MPLSAPLAALEAKDGPGCRVPERRLGSALRKPRVLGQRGEMSINDPRQMCRTLRIAHGRQTALMPSGPFASCARYEVSGTSDVDR